MRIIAGQYRGRVLRSPPSMQVRPTSDRLRETLFNILAPRITETRFLDLCTGSGAVGIEALSRGASFVTFVDRSRKMCALVESNLDLCGVPEDQTEVVMSEAVDFLRRTQARGGDGWDICFFDPPYATEYLPVLSAFGAPESSLLRAGGILIAEHHHKNSPPDETGALRRWRIVKQGDSALSFYERE
ncbi:MAG: 16S rRNA (guanine(966)-N(2))-methyltransferase RsmD [Pyrinomonadaceae bacterium]|nr:16S rRNA (guanine(966)-N(2))-methyltransferase RsmD [Pyrinomonadaceae bacterium]